MKRSMTALPSKSQRGAILVIALFMLLLLTIIGLSSMRATSLQENMAGSMRDSQSLLEQLLGAATGPITVDDVHAVIGTGSDERIGDFRVVASHQESLHSHDAVSLLTRGPTFAQVSLDPMTFAGLRA